MKTDYWLPEGEGLRRAVRWILEQKDHSARDIQEAGRRFDQSLADEAFLLRHFQDKPLKREDSTS